MEALRGMASKAVKSTLDKTGLHSQRELIASFGTSVLQDLKQFDDSC